MKSAKVFLSIALLLALTVSLAACGGSKLVGTWGVDQEWYLKQMGMTKADLEAYGVTADLSSLITFQFKKDGTGVATMSAEIFGSAQVQNFTWSESGSKLFLTADGETQEATFSISGKTLTLTINGQDMLLKKK